MMKLAFVAAPAAALHVLLSAPAGAQQASTSLSIAGAAASHQFQVEIADDPLEQTRGLMYRHDMPKDHGMLFDFGADRPASFWMRNTYIPLDMLFIREDGTIESIAERTTPLSERSIKSRGPVRYVLEINGGLSDELGIKPGDTVSGPAIDDAE
jgi:uncharacterized membrane protein (UPF0127 family)